MNYRECAKLLLQQDRIMLVTHRDPDGDTSCSAAALCSALRRLGKEAWVFRNGGYTRTVLPYIEAYIAPEDAQPKCFVTVDIAAERMFPAPFEGPVLLNVDHHASNTHYAPNELVRGEKSSCGEIVLELIKALCGSVSEEEATLLYIAVTTDTGCFQYANTSSSTLAAASELLRLGARQHEVSVNFFRRVSIARIKLDLPVPGPPLTMRRKSPPPRQKPPYSDMKPDELFAPRKNELCIFTSGYNDTQSNYIPFARS